MDNNVVYYVIIIIEVEVIFVELAISLSGGINTHGTVFRLCNRMRQLK
jgi:hypothetical protein